MKTIWEAPQHHPHHLHHPSTTPRIAEETEEEMEHQFQLHQLSNTTLRSGIGE
ncbi:hypothetical protein pipiens_000878 [Culex pipiens pipiens]|uniref:Uncharacterized protein n=2 Tax=Culex pipiens TaxID=7175 RepID=A0ABD1DW20_CULPP